MKSVRTVVTVFWLSLLAVGVVGCATPHSKPCSGGSSQQQKPAHAAWGMVWIGNIPIPLPVP